MESTLNYNDIHLVLVGPGKAGTTWLAQCLRDHPEVFITIETNYLADYIHLGIEYWRSRFDYRSGDEKLLGEHSNWYFSYENIPKKLAELNPNLKILICVRDPVDRILSAYRHDLRWGTLGRHISLSESIQENLFYNRYVTPSRYSRNIKNYLKHFPAEQIYLFASPARGEDTQPRLQDLFNFLDIGNSQDREDPIIPSASRIINRSVFPLDSRLHRTATFSEL